MGDRLTHVNGEAVLAGDYAEVRATLMGTGEVRLTLERDDAKIEKTIRLRRLI